MRRRFIQSVYIVAIVATSILPAAARAQQSLGSSVPVQMVAPAAPTAAVPATLPAATAVAPPAALSPAPATEPPAAIRSLAVSPGIGPLRELSPWSMFLAADTLVKAVMIGLAFASLVTWTLFFAKSAQLHRARRQLAHALTKTANCRSLGEAQKTLGRTRNVLGTLVGAALNELETSHGSEAGIRERTASRFAETQRAEADAARRGMGLIATVGATAPFVGLFGTVWGIMNSFIGISKAQTTNLAIVAPGIAEALLATAIGLVAAIPAVIIYNHFSRATKSYMGLVGRGVGAVGRLLSRDLDRLQRGDIARAAE